MRNLLLLCALLALGVSAFGQEPTNLYAAGVSYNNSATPEIAGSALYAHSLGTSGTYAFTVVDALPTYLQAVYSYDQLQRRHCSEDIQRERSQFLHPDLCWRIVHGHKYGLGLVNGRNGLSQDQGQLARAAECASSQVECEQWHGLSTSNRDHVRIRRVGVRRLSALLLVPEKETPRLA
jgi:hypothetical protein